MDLRMVKTRNQIKAAFLALRERCMPDKIKVKDLCEVAMINKTTFYNHYADSNELSNEIDENAIDMVLSDFSEQDKLLEDPKAYVTGLFHALERESAHLNRVFRGKQEVLCIKLEERLQSICSRTGESPEEKMKMSFAIGGFCRVVRDYLLANTKYSIDQLVETTTHLVEALLQRTPTPTKAST